MRIKELISTHGPQQTDEAQDAQLAAIKAQEKQLKIRKAQIAAHKAQKRLSQARNA